MFQITEYTQNNGLPDDYLNGILDDASGRIWVSTNAGISSLNPITGEIFSYNEKDGLSSSSYSESAGHKGENGILYFGSFSGLTFFDP